MRILIIRNFPSFMSVKNNTYNIQEVGLAKALVRKGHTCDIVFWTDREEEIVEIPVDDTGVIHVFYRHGRTKLKNTIFTNCEDLFEQYDILQPCEYNQMQAWLLAKNKPQKTVIYHGPYYCPFNKRYNLMCRMFDLFFLRRYIKQGTRFLVKSELAKEFLIEKGIESTNVEVAGVGIDVQMLSNKMGNCSEFLYQAMKKQKDGLKLLYIGRFEERRDIPFIIDVFKNVLEKKPNARLYMIGTGDSDYLKMSIEYMKKVGIRDKIIWQEKMEQKYLSGVYKQADFFLLPTEYEIFGMVLLESMYYGNVVLTTSNGGSSTLIDNGKNGFVFEKKETMQWSDCVLSMGESDKERIGKKAALTVMENYTWDRLAEVFLKEYKIKLTEQGNGEKE